jgi:hypothetical protein
LRFIIGGGKRIAAAARRRDRQDALAGWRGPLSRRGFDWVKPPVLNPYTRLAVASATVWTVQGTLDRVLQRLIEFFKEILKPNGKDEEGS